VHGEEAAQLLSGDHVGRSFRECRSGTGTTFGRTALRAVGEHLACTSEPVCSAVPLQQRHRCRELAPGSARVA
jgi:hypothetical protein